MKKILKIMSAICLVAVVGVIMAACGNGGNSNTPTPENSGLQGLYAYDYSEQGTNIYYINGTNYYFAGLKIEGNEVIFTPADEGQIKVYKNTVYQDRGNGGYEWIDRTKDANKNLAQSFKLKNDFGKYNKISSLTEFIIEIKPDFTLDYVTGATGIWLELLNE